MWSDFSGKDYSDEGLVQRIKSLSWTSWKPIGITLHNTAAPTLAQWAESGPKHEARIRNLQSYYEGLGWHGGPHWFESRTHHTEFSNPLRRGTHSPSFNATHFGIEMVGDYSREPFNSGDGAKVRDRAVFLMALLCQKFKWDPGKVIKLHKEDPRTTHDCPGKFVVKSEVIARVKVKMAELAGQSSVKVAEKKDGEPDPPPKWKVPDSVAFRDDVESGKASWYSQYVGRHTWVDLGDKPKSNALGVPDDAQGIALPDDETLGEWFEVRAPNGKVSIEQQTDVGPNEKTGRGIDISAAAAERFGYAPTTFPTDSVFSWCSVDAPKEVDDLEPGEQATKYRELRRKR